MNFALTIETLFIQMSYPIRSVCRVCRHFFSRESERKSCQPCLDKRKKEYQAKKARTVSIVIDDSTDDETSTDARMVSVDDSTDVVSDDQPSVASRTSSHADRSDTFDLVEDDSNRSSDDDAPDSDVPDGDSPDEDPVVDAVDGNPEAEEACADQAVPDDHLFRIFASQEECIAAIEEMAEDERVSYVIRHYSLPHGRTRIRAECHCRRQAPKSRVAEVHATSTDVDHADERAPAGQPRKRKVALRGSEVKRSKSIGCIRAIEAREVEKYDFVTLVRLSLKCQLQLLSFFDSEVNGS